MLARASFGWKQARAAGTGQVQIKAGLKAYFICQGLKPSHTHVCILLHAHMQTWTTHQFLHSPTLPILAGSGSRIVWYFLPQWNWEVLEVSGRFPSAL